MNAVERGLLRLYELESLNGATRETWPWWMPAFGAQAIGVDMPCMPVWDPEHLEFAHDLLTIVEKLRTSGWGLDVDAEGYRLFSYEEGWAPVFPTLAEAVRDALRFIGERRG